MEAEHQFEQNDQDVRAYWPMGNLTKKDVSCKITHTHVKVVLGGVEVFNDALIGKIDPEESAWLIEEKDGARVFALMLAKQKGGKKWRCLGKIEAGKIEESMKGEVRLMSVNDLDPDDDTELVDKNLNDETILEARFLELKAEKGLQNEDCLKAFFELYDNGIQLYRLNQLGTYLEEIVPECRKRTDQYKLKAIQALAFVLWKQSKFRQALPIFLEMEDILGKNAALCENIAHTYSSLGDYPKAEQYFREALKFIETGADNGQEGGTLLGLGLVRDRQGQHEEALPIVMKAYEFYKRRAAGKPSSLQAKTCISIAKINITLKNLETAEKYIREAISMYEITCGATSPLTASAYQELGSLLWLMRRRDEAQKALLKGYEIEAMKDAFDLVKVLEIHNTIMDTHLKDVTSVERKYFRAYFGIASSTLERVKKIEPQDGNVGVYYKAVGELYTWGGEYAIAMEHLMKALELLSVEKSVDCTNLNTQLVEMINYCTRCMDGTQQSPMTLDVAAAKADQDEREKKTVPQASFIEEVSPEEEKRLEAANEESFIEEVPVGEA